MISPGDGAEPVIPEAAESPVMPEVAESPVMPEVAGRLFGDRLELAERYVRRLATDGMARGLIGPREAPRLWDRHLLNSAVVAGLVPEGVTVVDVGSGAGLPGIPLALARPDLTVILVEPMARRTTFLAEVVEELSLADQVSVWRARAEECPGHLPAADVAVARALAPLDRLVRWCLPLIRVGGRVLALKGASAAEEVAAHTRVVRQMGGAEPVVRCCGEDLLDPPATVIDVTRRR